MDNDNPTTSEPITLIDARTLDQAGYAAAKRTMIANAERQHRAAADAAELIRVSAGSVGRPTCRTGG